MTVTPTQEHLVMSSLSLLRTLFGYRAWANDEPVSYTHLTLPTNREV